MSDGMGRESAYLSSHATNRYFIPNWGRVMPLLWYVTAKGKWYGFVVSTKMRNFAIDKILSLTYVLW